MFFSLVFPKDGNISLNWWGNRVNNNTPDTLGTPLFSLGLGEKFGLTEVQIRDMSAIYPLTSYS